jgi:hypothetical protein
VPCLVTLLQQIRDLRREALEISGEDGLILAEIPFALTRLFAEDVSAAAELMAVRDFTVRAHLDALRGSPMGSDLRHWKGLLAGFRSTGFLRRPVRPPPLARRVLRDRHARRRGRRRCRGVHSRRHRLSFFVNFLFCCWVHLVALVFLLLIS